MRIYNTKSYYYESPIVVIVSTKLEEENCKVCPKENKGILKGKDADSGKEIEIEVDMDDTECPCPFIKSRAYIQSPETIKAFQEDKKAWELLIKYIEEER